MNTFSIIPRLFTAFLFLFGLTSCEDLTVVTVETELVISFNFDINVDDQTGGGAITKTLNPNEIPELGNRLDKIKELDLTYARYKFSNYEGNENAVGSGTIEITQDGISININETNIKEASDNATIFEVSVPGDKVNSLTNAVKRGESRDVSASFSASNPPAKGRLDLVLGFEAQVEVVK
ncbi:MAG: hypothetical protein ACXITV_06045 [Luteibaculaceae bacterium]